VSIPSREEALKMLKQAGVPPHIIDHCLLVTKIALRFAEAFRAKGYEVDLPLIEAGAILHDIGRSQSHGMDHGAVGGIFVRKLGISENIARIVERHVGAGITEDEAKKNHLPKGSYMPETYEEKIVTYSDKLVEGDREVGIEREIDKLSIELGNNHSSLKRLQDLHEEIMGKIGYGL
jgi:uncharacterized protein